MDITHFLIPLCGIIIAIARAAGEKVVDFFQWNTSVFASKYPVNVTVEDLRKEEPKFTHPREVSWARKHTGSKFMQKLKSTILVGFTDLWHFADLITMLIAYLAIPTLVLLVPAIPTWNFLLLLVGTWIAYSITFHLFYHKFFYFDPTSVVSKDQVTINA